MSRFWEIVFCVSWLFLRHVCLCNLKHAPSRKLPLTARKTVFSHLNTDTSLLTESSLCPWREKALTFSLNSVRLYGHPVNSDTFYVPLSVRIKGGLTVLGPREKLWILTAYSQVVHVNKSCWAAVWCSSFVKCNSKPGSKNRVSEQNSEIFWNGQGYCFFMHLNGYIKLNQTRAF